MRFFRRRIAVPLALVTSAVLGLSACGSGTSGTPTDGTPTDGGLKVVVAFYPLQFTAERVAGEGAMITNLTQPGADAHDLELTPRQIAALSEADLVIHQKGFQPAVDAAIEQAGPAHVLDVMTIATMHTVDIHGNHEHADEHGAGHADEHDTPHPEDSHDHGNIDPHQWLNLENMAKMADATAAQLSDTHPGQRQAFQTNADAVTREYASLDEAYRSGLATCQRKEIIVSHAAFGYLTERYGLIQIPIRGLNPDVEPSPARVAEVQQLAREHGVTTVFYETLVSPAVAEAVAGDLGLRTDVLDPLEGLTPESKGSDYLEVMNANLTALKAASACT